MQITKKEVFTVDNINFPTEKEAQDYINQRDGVKSTQEFNNQLLDSANEPFVPIYDPESMEIDIFIFTEVENGGNWKIWKSLRQDQELRYYTEKLNVICADEFMERFKECPSIYLGTNEWNAFLRGIIHLNEKAQNPLDWREVIELIGQMQVTPEHIYND
jgi:hypothetical protein